ncbi:tRNA (guanosine(46)-N7)-methyltransferase TrmB [Pseudothermotoga thermarum]|uniref:tRNA (guanine-N(7)-)-methyltransferase n=1 Tax=Pseudothermotoga thermarum DSM 5069 TaxID=688269 RepID=F7YTD3_9THEM|nr:tRNA (guanosine(46)-N7)-methyltransferase TrmB [Pseudothermotoga thermarum]AEH50111.1 tRNA (guanine-N(7)-)-methyltransferase [Pseudothermotoga thermarum DSM 5069]
MAVQHLAYHIRAEYLDLPIDWGQIFKKQGNLIVEIGFGNGEFLLRKAKEQPFDLFVGFETSLTSLVKIQKRLFAEGIDNVRVCLVDGRFGLREFFNDLTVSTVYMNFPCPWPKKSHQSRRFTVAGFADTLVAVLKLGGIFSMTSDVLWYVEDMRNVLLETGCFEQRLFQTNKQIVVGTRYERKWINEGRETYTLVMEKIKHKTIDRLTWGEQDMPHVHLKDAKEEKIPFLSDQVFKSPKGVFVVKGVYKKQSEEEYLLRIVSNEENFQQRYFISIRKEKDGWLVKLDPDAFAYRTPVVKYSVQKIAEVIST